MSNLNVTATIHPHQSVWKTYFIFQFSVQFVIYRKCRMQVVVNMQFLWYLRMSRYLQLQRFAGEASTHEGNWPNDIAYRVTHEARLSACTLTCCLLLFQYKRTTYMNRFNNQEIVTRVRVCVVLAWNATCICSFSTCHLKFAYAII